MSIEISERSVEDAIECALLRGGPDASIEDANVIREPPPPAYGDPASEPWADPGGYRRRLPEDYDRDLCLLSRDVVDFILPTQPKEWKRLSGRSFTVPGPLRT